MPETQNSQDLEATYFANHQRAYRWPFSIYHEPMANWIEEILKREAAARKPARMKALNVGAGFFHEHQAFSAYADWAAMDVDGRVRDHLRKALPSVPVYSEDELAKLPAASFDLILAKEVVEHVVESSAWIKGLLSKLKPGGVLLLTTPNYGISLLPLVEYTFLELVARMNGYTRFDIHPNKYNRKRLETELVNCAPPSSKVNVGTCSAGMAIVAETRVP